MARSLVIVESPAKAKTINKYLGRNYTVKASYGHVMDLPRKTIGILLPGEENGKGKKKKRKSMKAKGASAAPEKKAPKPVTVTAANIFEPTYQVIPGKIKVINDLRKAARGADAIYLAGDPDREGEAICAHLEEILSNPREYSNLKEEGEDESKNGNEPKESAKKEPKLPKGKLEVPPIYRVMFNEITQKAIKAAF
jgi:DNA topoisomerase I